MNKYTILDYCTDRIETLDVKNRQPDDLHLQVFSDARSDELRAIVAMIDPPSNTPIGVGTMELLAAVVRKHYDPIKNPMHCEGAQMWNRQWWMPLGGCDTLADMLEDMDYAIDRKKASSEKAQR